jgi:hypothetical protein
VLERVGQPLGDDEVGGALDGVGEVGVAALEEQVGRQGVSATRSSVAA